MRVRYQLAVAAVLALLAIAAVVVAHRLLGQRWAVSLAVGLLVSVVLGGGITLALLLRKLERRLNRSLHNLAVDSRRMQSELTDKLEGYEGERAETIRVLEQQHEQVLQATRAEVARVESASKEVQEAMQQHLKDALLNEYRQIEALVALTQCLGSNVALSGLRGFPASPDLLLSLFRLIREHRPSVVLECGSGASTVVIARALQRNGHGRLVALEHLEEFRQETRTLLRLAELDDYGTVADAPLTAVEIGGEHYHWYDLRALPDLAGIDLLFVDGPPGSVGPLSRYPAVPLLADRLADRAFVLLDDADRPGERAAVTRWVDEFPLEALPVSPHEKGAALLRYRAADGVVGRRPA